MIAFTPSPDTCALHGDAGCYRRFSQCRRPEYVYQKRKVHIGITENVSGIVNWCVGVHPKPQKVTGAKCACCPHWRDAAGRDAETVRRLIACGEYGGAE